MKINNSVVLVVGMAIARCTLHADITIVNPAGADHTPFSICPAIDGSSGLVPDPVLHLPPPQAGQGIMAELGNTNNTDFSGWTFQAGAALNGTLTVKYYHSKFWATHNSGAQIEL